MPTFPPSAFLESTCLNDLTQHEKACLPSQAGAQEGKGKGKFSPPQANEGNSGQTVGPAWFRVGEDPWLSCDLGHPGSNPG